MFQQNTVHKKKCAYPRWYSQHFPKTFLNQQQSIKKVKTAKNAQIKHGNKILFKNLEIFNALHYLLI